jgi:hypothetical protein
VHSDSVKQACTTVMHSDSEKQGTGIIVHFARSDFLIQNSERVVRCVSKPISLNFQVSENKSLGKNSELQFMGFFQFILFPDIMTFEMPLFC